MLLQIWKMQTYQYSSILSKTNTCHWHSIICQILMLLLLLTLKQSRFMELWPIFQSLQADLSLCLPHLFDQSNYDLPGHYTSNHDIIFQKKKLKLYLPFYNLQEVHAAIWTTCLPSYQLILVIYWVLFQLNWNHRHMLLYLYRLQSLLIHLLLQTQLLGWNRMNAFLLGLRESGIFIKPIDTNKSRLN